MPTCTLGTIAASGSAQYTITVTVDSSTSGTLTNNAAVTSSTGDPDGSNNSTSEMTTVTPSADLSLTKVVDNAIPDVGSNITFTLTVSNAGHSDATGVAVGDLLPNGYTFFSASTATGIYTSGTGVWAIGSIANGGSATLTITASVNATGDFTNVAQVTAADQNDPDSTPNNNIATEDDQDRSATTSVPVADLSIPTLSEWGVALLGLLLAGIGVALARRKAV